MDQNKNEDNELGVNVIKKHSAMPKEMETFICDTIVNEKRKNSGSLFGLANAIDEKLTNQYGPNWSVFIITSGSVGFSVGTVPGSTIFLTHDGYDYIVFKTTGRLAC